MPDVGNPNAFKIYNGRFSINATDQLDHYCMMDIVNNVIFCGNYTADAAGDICTMNPELCPESTIKFPCYCSDDSLAVITIDAGGNVTTNQPGKQHLLRGLSYNICCNFYAGE